MKTLSLIISLTLAIVVASSCGKKCSCERSCNCVAGHECQDSICNGAMRDLGGGIYLINGHRFVDLDLPSGLLWAESNIGANNSVDAGDYFAWGETSPKADYSWQTYKYGSVQKDAAGNVVESHFTKYKDASKNRLDKEDDAAYAIWGKECRIPNDSDFNELMICSDVTWISKVNSAGKTVEGILIKSRSSSNSIFFPAVGTRIASELRLYGSYGGYWMSNLHTDQFACSAKCFRLSDQEAEIGGISARCSGFPIRPVANKPERK